MRFISGLKNLTKKKLLLIIVLLFVISWFLFTFGFDIFSNFEFSRYFLYVLGALGAFTFVLFIISFFKPIDEMGTLIIIVAIVFTIPIYWIFSFYFIYFYIFFIFSNSILTAFFAYKFCMDSSTKVDDYLYKKERSRIYLRILEFAIFFLLTWWFISLTIRFFIYSTFAGSNNIATVFFNLFLIGLVIIGVTLIRILFTKKFAAYISLFNMLTFFYVIYLVVDFLAEFIFLDSSGYDLFAFFIDLLLFIYIIGSIYERIEYIQEKLKIFRVDTIALFVILTKLGIQIIKIFEELYLSIAPAIILQRIIGQVQILWIIFAAFTLIIGLYTVFTHKEGTSSQIK